MRKKYTILSFALFLCFLLFGCTKQEKIINNPKDDLMTIKVTVQQYYINLEKMKYAEALKYVRYNDASLKQEETNWLEQNKNIYKILFSNNPDGRIVGYDYSPSAKQYRVISHITYEFNRKRIAINESIYLKKVNGVYKIIHISSNDMFLKKRCSSASAGWDEIYDKNEYSPIG